ncbi:hypothetical protein C8R32_104245 [Nitrosospira sp. Nsp5]|uniref:Uncharacterized protein n=1 Tax=Nitrosospira multiformis TaxID=1231 RepID=A0ABY0TJV9_9PROT|nr:MULTISPECIES: alpha/beta hydrolase [Nitrosospira]PTR09166.1 hypothetical protein C8R32_104245 [Nitrosospira sp. Nsp5]SDQ72438.1 hypothetical protein SAMN05216402_2024 [Nitrosospira multiformis]
MAEIVLVHGIDQQQKSADKLESAWLPALAGGVRDAGFADVADRIWRNAGKPGSIETRMAFYGNLFLMPGQQGDDPAEFTSEEAQFAQVLALEWLKHAVERASKQKTRETGELELAYITRQMGTEQGAGSVVRSAIGSLSKISWFAPFGMGFAERFVNRSLAQVTRYLTDDTIRSAALKSVFKLIGPETRVLIGHSLGSVIAYEAAHLMDKPLPLLLTLGSPLGLQTIVYQCLRPQPPRFPPAVRRWVNIADRDDFIAAEPDLIDLFRAGIPASASFEGGYTVDNGADPHNSDFYLGKVQIGREVGEIFGGSAVNAVG